MQVLSTLLALKKEWGGCMQLGGNWISRLRLATDFALSHALFAVPRGLLNKRRQVTTKSGVKLAYRLNRGDLQGLREVWFDEVYRLPFPAPGGAFLDFGANIGLTTIWMSTHYKLDKIIAVEPDHDNAALLAANLKLNGITAEIIEAAVGPSDGTVYFQKSAWSNQGHVSVEGIPVKMMSVSSLFKENLLDKAGLVKVDIEGGEQELFLGPCEWLQLADAMIVEFHPTAVDYPRLVKTVESRGFEYIAASPINMDCFRRLPVQ